jgi:hypothetical protein
MSLGEAINRLGILYKQEGRAKFDAASAVSAWGYSSLNGASLRVLSALKQFGLLDGNNDELRISGRGLTILLEPAESPEYTQALEEALQAPALFQQMLAEYGEDLPSDGAIISYLVRKQEFAEQSAKTLINSFRESVDLVRSKNASYTPLQAINNAVALRPSEEQAKLLELKNLDTTKPNVTLEYSFGLSKNTAVALTVKGSMPTPSQVRNLSSWLEIVKLQIEQAVRDAAEEEAEASADFVVSDL